MSRLYRGLLRLLPRDFRRDYADEMRRVVQEQWHERRPRGPWTALRFWIGQVRGVLRAALYSRRSRSLACPMHPRPPRRGRSRPMDGLLQDLQLSLRALRKRPGLTLMTVVTLALGIGASTAIFSAVHAVMFRPLPYGDVDRIVAVFQADAETGVRGQGLSAANARDLMATSSTLTAVGVAEPYSLDLQAEGRAESLRTWAVSQGFLDSLEIQPYLGRVFTPQEYVPDGEPVVMLGYRAWRERFGADPELVGQTLQLDGAPMTVVGVLPPAFKLPSENELWIPRAPQPYDDNARGADYMTGIARLAPPASLQEAQAELERLARGTQAQREYALRSALGAPSKRLMRLIAVDSAILAGLGGALGFGLAYASTEVIRALGAQHLPRIEEISVDRTVLLVGASLALLSAGLSAIVPALRFSRPDLRGVLHEGGRGTAGHLRGQRLRNGIVVVEIAAAVVLLVGAGLLGRSFATLIDRDLGFDPHQRLALQLFAYGYGQDGGMTRAEFVNRAEEELESLPGVRRVALTSSIPSANDGLLAAIDVDLPFTIVDRAPPPVGREPIAWTTQVSDGYLDVMGIPLVAGRPLSAADDDESPPVALVNRTFTRRYLGDGEPVGTKILLGSNPDAIEIVGVVGDTLPRGYESEPRPEILLSLRQAATGNLTFVIRTDTDPALVTRAAMQAIWRVNPEQSVWGAATLESLLADWLGARRFNLVLLAVFAAVAVALAAIGIYGLISFSVERRVAEMGIRRALGGPARSIVALVVGQAEFLAAVGLLLGSAAALALSRFLRGMLYGVGPTDPVTYVVLATAVLAVAATAALIPALRATRVDPMVALRRE